MSVVPLFTEQREAKAVRRSKGWQSEGWRSKAKPTSPNIADNVALVHPTI